MRVDDSGLVVSNVAVEVSTLAERRHLANQTRSVSIGNMLAVQRRHHLPKMQRLVNSFTSDYAILFSVAKRLAGNSERGRSTGFVDHFDVVLLTLRHYFPR